MALRYPSWDTSKYNCLHPSLIGVRVRGAVLEKIKQQESLQKQAEDLRNTAPTGNELRDAIVKMVSDRMGKKVPDGERTEWLRKAVPALQAAIAEKKAYPTSRKLSGLVESVHKVYDAFNRQQFDTDFKAIFGDKSTDHTEEIDTLEESVLECEEFISKEWPMTSAHMAEFFRSGHIPNAWMGLRVTPKMTAEQIGTRVIDAFIEDWRERAPLFAVPVTINGIAIASLPAGENRDAWSELWNFFRLGNIPKRIVYIHRIATQAAPKEPEVNEDLSHVPDVFKPAGKGRPKKYEGVVK